MARARRRFRLVLPVIAAASLAAISPLQVFAAQGARQQAQPPASQGTVVVERVENGPAFGAEFKYAQVNHDDAFFLGGYGGFVFDGKLLVGAAAYWLVDSDAFDHYGDDEHYYPGRGGCYYGCGEYYTPYEINGYGGLLLEWYALRTPAVAVSARGLIGGGVASVGWDGYPYIEVPAPRHGEPYPPARRYYWGDQGYFIFEPQANVTVRVAPGLAVVGGVGYRVIGWANGFEDQLQGITATFAIRFGGR